MAGAKASSGSSKLPKGGAGGMEAIKEDARRAEKDVTPPRTPGDVVEDSGGLKERLVEEERLVEDTREDDAARKAAKGKQSVSDADEDRGKPPSSAGDGVRKERKRKVTFNEEPDVLGGHQKEGHKQGGEEDEEDEVSSETPTLTGQDEDVDQQEAEVIDSPVEEDGASLFLYLPLFCRLSSSVRVMLKNVWLSFLAYLCTIQSLISNLTRQNHRSPLHPFPTRFPLESHRPRVRFLALIGRSMEKTTTRSSSP